MKRKIIISSVVGVALAATAFAAANVYYSAAASIKMTVTGFYLGTYSGGICGNWQTVFENASATGQNFTQNLSIGSGQAPLGSYDCLAIRSVNSLDVTVNSKAQGQCVGWNGQQVFSSGQSLSAYDLSGTVIGTNSADMGRTGTVYLFFRVGGQGAVFDPKDGAALNQAVTITTGTTNLSFKFVDGAGYMATNPSSTNGITDLQDNNTPGSCTFNDNNVSFAVQ